MDIKAIIKKIFITISVLFTTIPTALSCNDVEYIPKYDGLLMKSVLISDIHTDGDFIRDRNNQLRKSFSNAGNFKGGFDSIIMAGDITNSSEKVEYVNLTLFKNVYLNGENLIPAMGNHDASGTNWNPNFEKASKRFRDFCRRCGIKTDKNYYVTFVKGYKIIVLGTEMIDENNAHLSETQLNWLDTELNNLKSTDKPVFVVTHQKLYDGCYFDKDGKTTDSLEKILSSNSEKGVKIIALTGHYHTKIGKDNLIKHNDNFYELNMPTFLFSDEPNNKTGYGYILECYSDKLVFRGRNFNEDEWFEDIVHEIKL